MPAEVRVEVRPPWPFRLRGRSPDGLFQRRGAALQRLIHVDGEPVFCGVVQAAPDRVLFAARAATEAAAAAGVARMRFATSVDDDLREFHERFRGDRLIGRAVRQLPAIRVWRRPEPWEALAWAITEQLIEFDRACQIQRRMVAALGPRCAQTGLRDCPSAATFAAQAPAYLTSFDLAAGRAQTLRRAAIEVASGRVDLRDPDHEKGWKRLGAISGIGPWTLEMLALVGQGRYDQIPAGDLSYIKVVGRLLTGHPKARAEIDDVRSVMEPYGEWKGLAGDYLRISATRGWLPTRFSIAMPKMRISTPSAAGSVPAPAGTRW